MKATTVNATDTPKQRGIELLAPARDIEVGRQAILHGADAVYIGASSHGARQSASNSVDDLARLADFAHQYRAKVYATVNTLVYERELAEVERLIRRLYIAGVDALIVQDMSILRLDIPPIELHASTQCDTRTPEKAKFLEDVGFSQIVLARELTLEEIRQITSTVSVPVECFIHGALCVCYSGRCGASFQACGRSANRGECAQMCRLPYTLYDADGRVLIRDKHLLSLRDFNATHSLPDLLAAGVSSFKIEGRLKDASYVKNVTAWYRRIIDAEISAHPDLYRRSSCGECIVKFTPEPSKSFNRGFTDYFLTSRRQRDLISPDTPKSLGEPVDDINQLRSGDGIAYVDNKGRQTGAYFNGLARNGEIITSSGRLPVSTALRRTFNKDWEKMLAGDTASRYIDVDMTLGRRVLSAVDERGVSVSVAVEIPEVKAEKPSDPARFLGKLGNTIYRLRRLQNNLPPTLFVPASLLTDARRRLVAALDSANRAVLPIAQRRAENPKAVYPLEKLMFSDNVANSIAEKLYRDHGVKSIEPALEISSRRKQSGLVVMTTRHCILRELGRCLHPERGCSARVPAVAQLKHAPKLPLTIRNNNIDYRLKFDCQNCEMQLLIP